jgi:hypothetical protein
VCSSPGTYTVTVASCTRFGSGNNVGPNGSIAGQSARRRANVPVLHGLSGGINDPHVVLRMGFCGGQTGSAGDQKCSEKQLIMRSHAASSTIRAPTGS